MSVGMEGLLVPFIFRQLVCNLSMSKLAHCIPTQLCAIMLLKITLNYSVFNSLKQEIGWLHIGKKKYLVHIETDHLCLLSLPLAGFHLRI